MDDAAKSSTAPPVLPFDVRSVVETVTGALSATPRMRTADAMVGTALIALGARRHHPKASAVVIGFHAIDLAVGRQVPARWRVFHIQPDVSGDRIAVTIRRTLGPQ